jgi:hypothetical protein
MTGSLSGTYFSTVTLTANPTTITSSGVVKGVTGVGLFGAAGTAWTVENQGVVLAAPIYSIQLQAGGLVINDVGATIGGLIYTGGSVGTAAGTIVNHGTINNIRLGNGGTVTNALDGTLFVTGVGINGFGAPLTVFNAGAFIDTHALNFATDISFNAGGYVSNASTGTIIAAGGAIAASTSPASVYNAGTIIGSNGAGAYFHNGGTVTNVSGGTITGGLFGIRVLNGTGLVDNDGIINGISIGPFANSVMGVNLHGGTLVNRAAGVIAGYNEGAYVGSGGTVINQGTITASHGIGVYLNAGGVLTNAGGGVITAFYRGVLAKTGALTVTNQGAITGISASAIELRAGGTVSNAAGASINGGSAGSRDGVYISGGNGVVVNQGLITASSSFGNGVYLGGGGAITNTTSGTISGGDIAVYERSTFAVTISNAGTIAAVNASEYAIRLTGGVANRLIDVPGAVFSGKVQVGGYPGAISTTLELSAGASHGTIGGLGSQFSGFGGFSVDSSAYWVMTGSNSAYAVTTFTNQGTLKLTAATFTDTGVILNNGVISIDPSTLTVGKLTGTGGVTIGADSTLISKGTVATGETITFAGTNAVLELDSPGGFAGTINGFGSNAHIGFGAGTSITGGTIAAGNTLELFVSGGGTINLQLNPSDDFSGQAVSVGPSGVSLGVACFRAGTRIATTHGAVAVERLAVGDQVITLLDDDAVPRAVTWLGWREIDCRRHPRPLDVWPVRVRRDAFAAGVPHCDLWLSPNHAVYIDNVLIPIRRLINGDSIRQEKVDRVVYYHVELDQHDVLLAEGLPCETYLDTGDRADFVNGGPAVRLYPSFTPLLREAVCCAPFRMVGLEVERARANLAGRAHPAHADIAKSLLRG